MALRWLTPSADSQAREFSQPSSGALVAALTQPGTIVPDAGKYTSIEAACRDMLWHGALFCVAFRVVMKGADRASRSHTGRGAFERVEYREFPVLPFAFLSFEFFA